MHAQNLSSHELQLVQAALHQVAQSPLGFVPTAREVMAQLQRLIPSDRSIVSHKRTSDDPGRSFISEADPQMMRYRQAYERYRGEHPIMRHFDDHPGSPSASMRQVLRRRDLERNHLYQEFFKPLEIRQMLGRIVPVPCSPGSPTEAGPQPHFRYFERIELCDFPNLGFAICRARPSFTAGEVARFELFVATAATILVRELRYERALAAFEEPSLPASEAGAPPVPSFLRAVQSAAGLTGRQAEVLRWIAVGKTNEEIAIILGMSIRTAQAHVASVIEKLGVENRVAAACAAWSGVFNPG